MKKYVARNRRIAVAVLLVWCLALLIVAIPAAAEDADGVIVETKVYYVTSLAEARELPISAKRVDLRFTSQNRGAMAGAADILRALSAMPELRDFTINIPNSSRYPEDSLDLLKEFKNLDKLTIRDARDYKPKKFFEQLTAIKGVKELSLAFL